MADEEDYGELAEISLSQYGGGSGRWMGGGPGNTGSWGRGGGSVSVINSPQHLHGHHSHHSQQRFSSSQPPHQPPPPGSHMRGGSYEAEDVMMARGGGGGSRGRSGLYYSPPGTSYTIVERPPPPAPTPGKHPRGTYLGSSTSFMSNSRTTPSHHHHHHASGGSNGKKRPISPEQVLRLFGTGGGGNKMAASPHMSHHGSGAGRRSAVSSPASSPSAGGVQQPPHLNIHQDLVVRTVNMVRPPDSTHGFGICVKGGKDSGVGVYISRVEEGSVAERAGLRPGDTILEVNGTPFSTISHEEALKNLMTSGINNGTKELQTELVQHFFPEKKAEAVVSCFQDTQNTMATLSRDHNYNLGATSSAIEAKLSAVAAYKVYKLIRNSLDEGPDEGN